MQVGYKVLTELTEVSGTGMNFLQNSQKYRAGYGCCTELTKVSGTGIRCGTRTPGMGMNFSQNPEVFGLSVYFLQNSQKCPVRV